ncbi:MAG: ABC transporter substrate-binding protein [Proteobacteria bacterium]|nr:ABC transporter substrate-binding protein [Pseudomonadota bacterium]
MRRAFPELKQLSKFEGRRRLIRLATHAMFAAAGISSTSSAVALAQGEMRRIGMLWPGLEQQPRNMRMRAAFQDRLRELGHVEGSTIQIHARYAGGALDRLPALARELVAMCDVIVAVTAASSVAVRGATSTIPIVMVHVGNPIGAGLVESLARPGGNVTGTTSMLPELAGKQVEMLHEVLPSARRVALLGNPTNSGTAPLVESASATARLLGLGTGASCPIRPGSMSTIRALRTMSTRS